MKIYISADIEGVAGIAAWDEAIKKSPDYNEFRQQMTAEVAAACEGAIEAGATEIVVKDAHGTGRNIFSSQLPSIVKLIRGWSGHPNAMMQEIDSSFDAALMVGYHSAAFSMGNPLAHTLSSSKVYRLMINGQRASEFLCNTYTAYSYKVPVVFVSGDKALCKEVKEFCPLIQTAVVTEGIGNSTLSLQPSVATDLIRNTVAKSLKEDINKSLTALPNEFQIELSFKGHADAYKASFYPGASRKDATTVCFTTQKYSEVLTFLLFVIL
jgi:D-amino peptidase